MFLCFINGLSAGLWAEINISGHWYIPLPNTTIVEGIICFFTYSLLTAGMIPISLIVSLEFVKLA